MSVMSYECVFVGVVEVVKSCPLVPNARSSVICTGILCGCRGRNCALCKQAFRSLLPGSRYHLTSSQSGHVILYFTYTLT